MDSPTSPGRHHDRVVIQDRLREEIRNLKIDLGDKAARLEATMAEKAMLAAKVQNQGCQSEEEKNHALDQVLLVH